MQTGWGPPPQYPPRVPYGYPQPPAWQKPPIDSARLRPKAWLYALAAIPLALGVAGAAICIVIAVKAFPSEPAPFTAPGSKVLRLDDGEDQTIYRQTAGASVAPVAGTPACTVRNIHTERLVRLHTAGNTTLSLDEDTYVTELHFEPPSAGSYRVFCRPPAGAELQPLAVGERPRLALFGGMIVAAIASFVVGALLAGGVIALVAVLRHRHKRRLENEAAGYS